MPDFVCWPEHSVVSGEYNAEVLVNLQAVETNTFTNMKIKVKVIWASKALKTYCRITKVHGMKGV